jgi:precorrin-2 dehydrogenase/sirohydrochlorin ferrochelatase
VTPPLYPVGLILRGRRCLVVGGGRVAAGKVRSLLAADAEVTVVAPVIDPGIASAGPRVSCQFRPYRRGDVDEFRFVIAATDDPAVNQAVWEDAESAGIWVNVADDPERCSVTLPAVVRRGPVTVAVSSDGRSPALSRWVRDRIAGTLPDGLAEVADTLAAERQAIRAAGGSTEGRDWARRIDELLAESTSNRPES